MMRLESLGKYKLVESHRVCLLTRTVQVQCMGVGGPWRNGGTIDRRPHFLSFVKVVKFITGCSMIFIDYQKLDEISANFLCKLKNICRFCTKICFSVYSSKYL